MNPLSMPRWLERALAWVCLAALALFASILSAVPVLGLYEGRIKQFSKYSRAPDLVFHQDPVAFVVAVTGHSLLALVFWWLLALAWDRTRRQR